MSASPRWCPEELLACPIFASIHAPVARLPRSRFPTRDDLNALATEQADLCSHAGAPIRFVAPRAASSTERPYELRVYETGQVETRDQSWHDLFNALVWLALPLTKAMLNRHHAMALRAASARSARGTLRDVLTLFDESGVIVTCASPELGRRLRDFEWKALFWEGRRAVLEGMRCWVFGHSLLAKALAPYPSITGRALIIESSGGLSAQGIDVHAARVIGAPATLASTRSLAPLPIMGVPGWCSENSRASFYDDAAIFRPGRRE